MQGYDVFLPHSYEYAILVPIPQGYTAKGLDKLTVKLDNSAGSFVAGAEFKDNVVT